ncbi:MAG: peptide-methionine (R)-S-oxide reductase [Flavobacteriia bacterium]|nr:MAG: peptide-methionine (R)-S-oxide reductase [Flavobacteriia bacterium]
MKRSYLTLLIIFTISISVKAQIKEKENMSKKVVKTEEEWKKILTPQQYKILRLKGTDMPGEYGFTDTFEKGTYYCAACGAQLFESGTKYNSHCGWPSFDDAIKGAVIYKKDTSYGMIRTEILCARCGGHLGHVFDDGPKETTGKRYCVNSTSLSFKKEEK